MVYKIWQGENDPQTFSSSVADALIYYKEKLKSDTFQESEYPITFCRNMYDIVDFLNTRNLLKFPTKEKKPLCKNFENENSHFINNSITYFYLVLKVF